jgi:hypothetical protein
MSISPGGTADSADERGDAPAVLAALGVDRSAVVRSLYAACLLLTIVGGVAEWLWDDGGWKYRFVQLNGEANLPTWYSTSQLSLAAVLAWVCGSFGRLRGLSGGWAWRIVAAALAFVSLDEVGQVHERVSTYADRWLATGGPDWWAWTIPYGTAGVLGAFLLRSWWRSLPTSTRRSFLVGAVVFASGAIGLELAEAAFASTEEYEFIPVTMTVVEEAFEMFAVAYVIGALLAHIDGVSRLTIGGVPRADIA